MQPQNSEKKQKQMSEEHIQIWMDYYMTLDKDVLCKKLIEAEMMCVQSMRLVSDLAAGMATQCEINRNNQIGITTNQDDHGKQD